MDGNNYVSVNIVVNNKSKHSPCDYSCSVNTRKLQKTIGRDSLKTYLDIVDNNNCLLNYLATCKDIITAENTFGPEVGCFQGKTVHQDGAAV
eukprot:7731794-Ditylum_brightwellii.AAC.1